MARPHCLAATQTCEFATVSKSAQRCVSHARYQANFLSTGRAGGSVETEEDLYSILQVPRDAEQREIKQAFYQSADRRCL